MSREERPAPLGSSLDRARSSLEPLWDTWDVAKALKVKRRMVYEIAELRALRIKIGGRLRWKRSDIERLIEEQTGR